MQVRKQAIAKPIALELYNYLVQVRRLRKRMRGGENCEIAKIVKLLDFSSLKTIFCEFLRAFSLDIYFELYDKCI